MTGPGPFPGDFQDIRGVGPDVPLDGFPEQKHGPITDHAALRISCLMS
jgi:hypothetical protein